MAASMIMDFLGRSSDACDSVAGYISFVETAKYIVMLLVVSMIASFVSKLFEETTRIQTTIQDVAPDTHVLHEFPSVTITPRQERRSRRVKQGDRYVTEHYYVTVYDASNFRSPNGTLMNTLRGLETRPSSAHYPVRLHNGSINGGTVMRPSKFWNPCNTTLDHKGKKYTNVRRAHDQSCETLVGKGWDVYLTKEGNIHTTNAGAYGKVIAQIVGLLAVAQLSHQIFKLVLLVSNDFYSSYKLPELFKTELGDAGRLYHTWWTRAFKADTAENCLGAIGDLGSAFGADSVENVTDAAANVATAAESVTETAALAYLSAMARADDVRNVDVRMSSLAGGIFGIVSKRIVLLCVLCVILYLILKQYIFTTILKVEEGNDRPIGNYVLVALCAVVLAIMFRKYVYMAHSARIRNSFKSKVLEQLPNGPLLEEFRNKFHSIDHSRIAI